MRVPEPATPRPPFVAVHEVAPAPPPPQVREQSRAPVPQEGRENPLALAAQRQVGQVEERRVEPRSGPRLVGDPHQLTPGPLRDAPVGTLVPRRLPRVEASRLPGAPEDPPQTRPPPKR